MLYFHTDKGACTGCGACYAACPVKCIEMVKDTEGFLYPQSSDACIHCGKCEKVCPIRVSQPQPEQQTHKAYCVLTKNKKIWRDSASGGAFTELCRAFGDESTLVVGAAWEGFDVVHHGVIGVDNIAPLRKSKYVFSEAHGVLDQIKKVLLDGEKVIFCGTPCQVAGVRRFLGKDYDNLLLIDLICHGVGSPKVFKDCIKLMEKQLDFSIDAYQFRAKRSTYDVDYLAKVTDAETGKVLYIRDDPYIQLFLRQDCLRPCCGENCRFRRECRQGDITIADFKHLTKVFPSLVGDKYNYSSVISNNQKGECVVSAFSSRVKMLSCALDDIKAHNPLFYRQTVFSNNRDHFFGAYEEDPIAAIEKQTTAVRISKRSLIKRAASILPQPVRKAGILMIGRMKAWLLKKA